jgi:hypothetical protein
VFLESTDVECRRRARGTKGATKETKQETTRKRRRKSEDNESDNKPSTARRRFINFTNNPSLAFVAVAIP